MLTSSEGWCFRRSEVNTACCLLLSRKFRCTTQSDPHRSPQYTETYAANYNKGNGEAVFDQFAQASKKAHEVGLGVNAGHDLNLRNLGKFCSIPNIAEVSIGHALVSDALEMGMFSAVRAYLKVLEECNSSRP